jgi:glucose-1-phosphate thymidylyltransferase
MQIVVFEDAHVVNLEPITLARAAYSIQCGSLSLADWLAEQPTPVQGMVRPHLGAWQAAEYPRFAIELPGGSLRLLVNARLVPCPATFRALSRLLQSARPCLVFQGESLAAAVLPPQAPSFPNVSQSPDLAAFLMHHEVKNLPNQEIRLPLFHLPHDLVGHHLEHFVDNLQYRIERGHLRQRADGVFAAENAEVSPWVDLDCSQGPIVLEAGCSVRPFSCLRGPLYLGPMSRVNEHSLLRPGVSVGPMSKVGGEIEASVVEAFTNKQHLGYLGHSYLGRWVNLGAGTSNSNLKNTYGTIRMQVGPRRVDTGLQFMGSVVGDFTKSAINTAIFTGKLIGTCSMLYGYVTTNVPSFVNYARSFGELTELRPEVVAQTQKRVYLRRGIEQQAWHVRLLHDVYEMVSSDRQLADRPVSL